MDESKEIKSIDQSKNPAEQYESAKRARNKKYKVISLIIIVQIVLFTFVFQLINKKDLNYRVYRELENAITGQNYFKTGTYIGDTDFGYLFGNGYFNFNSGSVYSGEFKNDYIDGIGVFNYLSEGKYEGEFACSQKSGKGKFSWKDGSTYIGEFEKDALNGTGVYIGYDGTVFDGEFEDNKFKKGNCTFSDTYASYYAEYKEFDISKIKIEFKDGSIYEGTAKNNGLTGKGLLSFANQETYDGEFKDGKKSGLGTYNWINGDVYSGNWNLDKMDGQGEYIFANGDCAKGIFSNNSLVLGSFSTTDSKGSYMINYEDSEPVYIRMSLNDGTEFSSEIFDDQLTGDAKITYSNQDTYEGEVFNGKKEGSGTYKWKDGSSYTGKWINDKMNGSGTYYYSKNLKGYKLIGTFVNGYPNGECTYYETENKSYKTDWYYGRCVKIYE